MDSTDQHKSIQSECHFEGASDDRDDRKVNEHHDS